MNILYEKCKGSDKETVKIDFENEGKILSKYLHSKYDPIREAKKWAELIYNKKIRIYVIYGGGLLYHILELKNLIEDNEEKENIKIIVFEPIEELYFKNKDLDFFKDNPNIIYTNIFDDDDTSNIISRNMDSYSYNKLIIEAYSPYKDYETHNIDIIYQAYKMNIYYSLLSFNTVEFGIDEAIENLIGNYKIFNENISINGYKDKFKGKTAVIVSAGPSLDKNIKDLKEFQNDIVIFTGGRSLRALLNAGIKPHFNTSMDMKLDNYELYKKYDLLKEEIPLITVLSNNHNILKEYKGIKIFSNSNEEIKEEDFNNWYERKTEALYVSGTVALLQVSAAVYMGFKKIVFIGQDLAYTDNKFYADSSSNDDGNVLNEEYKTIYKEFFYVKGNYQEKILTKGDLNAFRLSLQEAIKFLYPKDCEFINSTKGGAFIEGTKIMTLKEALKNIKCKSEKSNEKIMNIFNETYKEADYNHIYNKLNGLFKDMKKIENISQEALNISKKLKKFKNISNIKYLNQLDQLDRKFEKYKMAFNFIKRFNISFSIDVLGKDSDSLEKIVENTKKMYKDINNISKKYIFFLEKELKEIEKLKN